MSELVGSSALRPPRFLVLDEVFGSLDSERRSQLLETLGSLAKDRDARPQTAAEVAIAFDRIEALLLRRGWRRWLPG